MNQIVKSNPKRSLRSILALWFLSFAIVPIIFLTFYSQQKFQQTIDNELVLRLKGNSSEIQVILKEYQKVLSQQQLNYVKNSKLHTFLISKNFSGINDLINDWQQESTASGMTVYSQNGELISETKSSPIKNESNEKSSGAIKKITLHDKIRSQLIRKQILYLPDHTIPQILNLTLISPVYSNQNLVGYFKQSLTLDSSFLKKISERMQIQAILLEPNGRIIVGSHPDFLLYKTDFFTEYLNIPKLKSLTLSLRGEPYGFIFSKISWGDSNFQIALAVSKKESNSAVDNLRTAYYTVVMIMFVVLALFVLAASNLVLRPLSELIEAIQDIHLGENIIELPIKSDNEIGQLTTSFNDLSRRILSAQNELKNKIKELESANSHLKETQTQLVQSAKLASLGQLVAGVAHELNNPIGFIFSNMSHLREYSDHLLQLIDVAEKDPSQLSTLKEKLDLDYIRKDLPRLITSCEDGAKRTKDIVIGLRNFSRLEEKSYKSVDIHQSLDTTLSLLSSEFKNRIEIKKEYGNIPPVTCNQNQINQVFMNILSNAFQAIKNQGTVWISTKLANKSLDSLTPSVSISIQDTGPGVAPDVLQKIFDPFFTTKGVGQGTGLGLAISYGIINAHGGSIKVTSKVDSGTEFVITLPIEPPKDAQQE